VAGPFLQPTHDHSEVRIIRLEQLQGSMIGEHGKRKATKEMLQEFS
jgi:hypothetical protein